MTAPERTRLQQQVITAQTDLDLVIGSDHGDDAWYWRIARARRALAQAYLEVATTYKPESFAWRMARDLYKATARIADEDERDALAAKVAPATPSQALGTTLRGAYIDEVQHTAWTDEPQPLVDDLEQRTAALAERTTAERKQRDRNRLANTISKWWPW